MNRVLRFFASFVIVGVCVCLASQRDTDLVQVRLKLVHAATGKGVGGMVRVSPSDKGQPLALAGLLDRLTGVKQTDANKGWYVLPADGAEVSLPRAQLRLEAVSGLETALARQNLDLRDKAPAEVAVKLVFLFQPEKENLIAGNTHLHLMKLTRKEADEYLRQVPAADGLRVMFISYLERDKDDKTYITNEYPIGEVKEFRKTGVLFNNGEEHRHNFTAYGQGYGHVMFLDLKELVRPVSLGPGITGKGDDDRALRPGIDEARKQGATILWCHNAMGHEDVPSVLTGRLDALNVFDGTRQGTFDENYYRYLNIGLRLPISTGTDWFLYDFSRVYAQVKEELTIRSWLQSFKAGRCVATNGPLLRLTVNGKPPGEVLHFDKDTTVTIHAEGVGRHKFETLELVRNGKVLQEARPKEKDAGFQATITREVRITEPSWFAVRISGQTRNELDQVLFAHSCPVYVDYRGARTFDVKAGQALLRQLEEGRVDIKARGRFSNPAALAKVLAIYDEAEKDLKDRINKRGRP